MVVPWRIDKGSCNNPLLSLLLLNGFHKCDLAFFFFFTGPEGNGLLNAWGGGRGSTTWLCCHYAMLRIDNSDLGHNCM